MKVCNNCGVDKEDSFFYIRWDGRSPLSYACKECICLKARLLYKKNIREMRKRAGLFRLNNPERIKQWRANHYYKKVKKNDNKIKEKL